MLYYCTYVGAVDLSAQPEASRAALLSRETARGSIESYSWGVEPEAGPLDAATTVVLQQEGNRQPDGER